MYNRERLRERLKKEKERLNVDKYLVVRTVVPEGINSLPLNCVLNALIDFDANARERYIKNENYFRASYSTVMKILGLPISKKTYRDYLDKLEELGYVKVITTIKNNNRKNYIMVQYDTLEAAYKKAEEVKVEDDGYEEEYD